MAKPLLDGIHLSSEVDTVTLREGIKLGRKLCTASAFDGFRKGEVYPTVAVQSDADIDAYVRSTVHSANALTVRFTSSMQAANGRIAPLCFLLARTLPAMLVSSTDVLAMPVSAGFMPYRTCGGPWSSARPADARQR